MRKGILVVSFSLLVFALLAAPAAAAFQTSVSISVFHDTLAPHGRWIVTHSYGEVWVPAGIDATWQPYWNGEWVWTDYGWTWVSYDPWGDIPFHYGTWTWVDGDGWAWIPGTVWAPAWVTWAWTDNCVGWAPVPATFALTATGYFGSPVVLPASRYVFVPANQFVASPIQRVRFPSSRNAAFLASARTATRFSVSGGVVRTTADPPPAFVQRVTGRQLQRVSIEHAQTHPTALTATSHTGHIGVVAPARERAAMNVRTTANERNATGRAGTASAKARVASARHASGPSASSASVRHGAKSSSSVKSSTTVSSRAKVEKNSRPESRAAGSTSVSRTHSESPHEPKPSKPAPEAAQTHAGGTAHGSQPQAHHERAATAAPATHPAPEAHTAPHAAAGGRAAPKAPPPKQHPPKPKDQEHS
jgi:hypothetical protein